MSLSVRKSITAVTSMVTGGGGSEERSQSMTAPVVVKEFATSSVGADVNDEQITDMQIELGHAKMQLMAETDEIKRLEVLVEKAISESQELTESSLIRGLRASLDALRDQLDVAVTEKQKLAVSTASEMNRLRDMIRLMTEQVIYLTDRPPAIKVFSDYETLESAFFKQVPRYLILDISTTRSRDGTSGTSSPTTGASGSGSGMEVGLLDGDYEKGARRKKRSMRANSSNFPRVSKSSIDMITLEAGDGVHYADPYAVVDIVYKGYIYHPPTPEQESEPTDDPKYIPSNWKEFTPSDEGAVLTHSTNLGFGNNIIGLEMAILSMTLGEKCRVFVPERLGYGESTADGWVAPHSDLIFDIKLRVIHSAEPRKG